MTDTTTDAQWLEERTKSYTRRKVIFGGTPTVEGFSRIDAAYKSSDQRQFWVPCPSCGETQVLAWEHVRWTHDAAQSHEVFGDSVPESARYCCPHCGGLWTDAEKTRAVRLGEWKASAAFHGIAGFYVNELYSPFPGSLLPRLVEKYLTAQHAMAQGDDTKLRSFRNNTEGLAYAYQSTVPDADKLRARAKDYTELTVPWGGVVLTAGVDVQHDRLAVVIRAWGRGEESYLVWWGEIPGRTMMVHWDDDGSLNQQQSGAWWDLDQLLAGGFPHASGAMLRIRAVSIDSSDGQTQDAVYSYVRRRLNRQFMAVKGRSVDTGKDVFSAPKISVDTNGRHKPHASGIRPYMVGTQTAKDLILGVDAQGGRIKLEGNGPGRMHWMRTVRPDYYDQVTAEVKVPHKSVRGRLVWQCKSGRRNEALDCEVYALHAARSLKINLWRSERWEVEEEAINQPALFGDSVQRVKLPSSVERASEVITPSEAGASDGPKEGADNPGPGEPEAAVQTPARPARPLPKQKPKQTYQDRTTGWSAKNW